MAPTAPADRHGFQIAIICALGVEADAVHDVFDSFWEDEGLEYGQEPGDNNSYTPGVISGHNVVLAYMPGTKNVDASAVAANLQASFRGIRLTLLVGTCGGVPRSNQSKDIHLGDLVVSTSVIQYDFGKQHPATFECTDTLNGFRGRPNQKIRSILTKLRTRRYYHRMQTQIQEYVSEAQMRYSALEFPGEDRDNLYKSSYQHKHRAVDVSTNLMCQNCASDDTWVCQMAQKLPCEDLGCDNSNLVLRSKLSDKQNKSTSHVPEIHFGKVGSANAFIRSGQRRDDLAKSDEVIAFETAGAGILDQFPGFLMIKGVCDYADGHKSKAWQPYAALIAAAGTKAFLNRWASNEDPRWFGALNTGNSDVVLAFAGIQEQLRLMETSASTPNGAIEPKDSICQAMYSSSGRIRRPKLGRIDSEQEIEVQSLDGRFEEEASYQKLRSEIQDLGAAIAKMQSAFSTLLVDFKQCMVMIRELPKETARQSSDELPKESPKILPDEPSDKPPVRFKDAIGRKYHFPFDRCRTWTDMENLIVQGSRHVKTLSGPVSKRRYDLIGPDQEIIMPEYWDSAVKPDLQVTMVLWPQSELFDEPQDQLADNETITSQLCSPPSWKNDVMFGEEDVNTTPGFDQSQAA